MIRQANRYDKTWIIEMIQQFGRESGVKHLNNLQADYLDALLNSLFAGLGVVLVEENKGLIIGVINNSIWDKEYRMLHEIAWYVKPEFRNTPIGYRLLKEYIKQGDELKAAGRVSATIMGRLVTSPDIKYNKFGFTKLEESWIK